MDEPISFWNSWYIWRDAVIVAIISAIALSYLGVWVVLKRVVYVPLALSQVSTVGVIAAFIMCNWKNALSHSHDTPIFLDPAWTSLIFALLAGIYFSRQKDESGNATAVAYLLSAGIALILAGFIRQDLHDVNSILFGSAVLVETIQILYVGVGALIFFLIHFLFYRRFLLVSFDADSAKAGGYSVYRYEILMYISFAIMISVATRAIGALPAFGFTVLPAMVGLHLGSSMTRSFIIAILVGIICATGGYYLSFVWELPTGATMVTLAGGVFIVARYIPSRLTPKFW